MGLGYGRSLSEKFSVGGHLKKHFNILVKMLSLFQIHQVVENNVSNAVAFDFGTIRYYNWNDFTFGMSVRNFSDEAQYAYDGFQLPLTFRIGCSINIFKLTPSFSKSHSLLLALDALHPRSYTQRMNIGLEYSYLESFISARFGYLHNYDEEILRLGQE